MGREGDRMSLHLIEECIDAKRIGIGGHIRPDGDCVGACLGLWQYLRKCLPQAHVQVFLEKPADIFQEIKGFGEICSDFPDQEPFDVFFVLDSTVDRLGAGVKYAQTAVKTINIDHHISNEGSCQLNVIKPEVGSTCEVLYDLMDLEKLDQDMAQAIFVGMIHDTGVFQYSNTTPATLEKGARLIGFGFDFSRLIQETFYQKTYVQAQIMGRTLMESIRFLEGNCIVSSIDRKTMEFYHAEPKDLEGIVNQLRNIEGIECAIFMYETGVLEYKVSLRSGEKVNVAEVAAYFGGGGHGRAAGCTLSGTFHDCVNNLSLHIEKQLKKWEAEHDKRDNDDF